VAQGASLKVKNLRQLHRALKNVDDDLKRELEQELRAAGDIVALDAQQRFSVIDVGSAAGIRSRVKGFGRVVVEQQRRKRTGERPDFGALQMRRALLPARAANEDRVLESVEGMLDRIGREAGF
jgi:hypothetical protein